MILAAVANGSPIILFPFFEDGRFFFEGFSTSSRGHV